MNDGSAVDGGHVSFVVAFAGGWREVVEPFDVIGAQHDAVCGCVLLDSGDPLGAGDRGDVVALRQQPASAIWAGVAPASAATAWTSSTMRGLRWKFSRRSADWSCAGRRRNICGGTDLAGEKTVPQRRIGNEADAQLAAAAAVRPPRRGSTGRIRSRRPPPCCSSRTGSGTPLATPNQLGDPRLRLADIPRVGG